MVYDTETGDGMLSTYFLFERAIIFYVELNRIIAATCLSSWPSKV